MNLKTITNPNTGNQFDVIAKTDHAIMAIRFWHYPHSSGLHIGMRLRFEATDASLQIGPYLENLYPEQMWTGGSEAHKSIAGMVLIPLDRFKEQAPAVVVAHTLAGVHDVLSSRYRIFTAELNRDEFAEKYGPDMVKGIEKYLAEAAVDTTFSLGATAYTFKDGEFSEVIVMPHSNLAGADSIPAIGDVDGPDTVDQPKTIVDPALHPVEGTLADSILPESTQSTPDAISSAGPTTDTQEDCQAL